MTDSSFYCLNICPMVMMKFFRNKNLILIFWNFEQKKLFAKEGAVKVEVVKTYYTVSSKLCIWFQ